MYQEHQQRSVKPAVFTTAEIKIEGRSFLIIFVKDYFVNVQLRKICRIGFVVSILQRKFADVSARCTGFKIIHDSRVD